MSVTIADNVRRNSFKENVPIQDEHLYTDLQTLLDSVALEEGFSDYNIQQSLIPATGGNFLGILHRVTIRGKKQKQLEELHLFMKAAADNKALREAFPLHDVYCNEMFVYKVLSLVYNALQEHENIPINERYHFTKFFGSIETDLMETIVLDDLSYKEYRVQDRFEPISLEFAKTATSNLAKFHCLSYVLERRDPRYFADAIKTKRGNMYIDGDGPERLKHFGTTLTDNVLKHLRNSEYSERLSDFCKDMCADVRKFVKVNKRPVLCHGDYRVNNMLVKYENEAITSLIPIDYQLIHCGSPLNDLLYFLFGATDRKFRKDHFDYILNFYYESLAGFLRRFSYDVSEVYPKSEFDSDAKSHMMMGLVVAVHVLPFMLVSEENAPDLNELNESIYEDMGNSANEVFKERFNGIVEDYVEWGYL